MASSHYVRPPDSRIMRLALDNFNWSVKQFVVVPGVPYSDSDSSCLSCTFAADWTQLLHQGSLFAWQLHFECWGYSCNSCACNWVNVFLTRNKVLGRSATSA
mmetsp:Transcript_15682/g.32683  ORF Transcript_15682/g.32683 Transcript_15682/m.32683 type:complete len:102 (-) Transcript_15682:59-364(-)